LSATYKKPAYFNYDSLEHARIIQAQSWPLDADLLVFDEIHKMKSWKRYLKGVYDTRSQNQAILVTGSSRMDTFRQSGDSLAGRYYHIRLHPLSVKELQGAMAPFEAVNWLNRLGGFPEPFLSGSEEEAARWRRQYYTDLIREDILEFSRLHEVRAMRLLVELLRQRVGSPLSYASLAGDLQIAPNTARKYVDILESLHIVFLVRPFHVNVARSVLKEPKLYFYDTGFLPEDEGIRFENTCAVCLLKHVQFLQDVKGEPVALHYIRTKDRREVDFAIARSGKLELCLEAKLSDAVLSPALKYFAKQQSGVSAVQLVHNVRQEQSRDGISIVPAGPWLAGLSA
jgi:predicted AAA+ superfamily ATPase